MKKKIILVLTLLTMLFIVGCNGIEKVDKINLNACQATQYVSQLSDAEMCDNDMCCRFELYEGYGHRCKTAVCVKRNGGD